MAVIGSAYIAVHAITKGFEREVKKALREMQPAIEQSGERTGKTFVKGFKQQTKTSLENFDPLKGNKNFEGIAERLAGQFSRSFKKATKENLDGFDPLKGGNVKETFRNAGARTSKAFAQGFKQTLREELSDFDPLRGTKDIYREAGSRASAAFVADFKRDVRLALKDLADDFRLYGDRAGQQFAAGFRTGAKKLQVDLDSIGRSGDNATRRLSQGFSNFTQEALAAYNAFSRLVTISYFTGPAIAVVVGAISSLVGGLVALTAQVGAAVPSLIVLPGIFAAIGQAALTAKLAFGGIGKAVQEITRQQAGGGGGGGADRARQIALAERNLARVLEANREALVRANDNLTKAEERLTEARKEAAESLQQLNFDAEDAAISEKRAAIELEKARETLARVQDLPPNSRARREAELAYAEADLNLRRAKDRNADLAKATEEANAKGVEGSEQVVQATEALQDAIDSKARTERDALRSQLDAEEALAEAKKRTGGGAGAAGTPEFDKLSEEAKAFAQFIVSLQGEIQKLRNAAGEELFPRLQIALQNLVDRLFPVLIPMLRETGRALGDAAIDFSNMVTEAENLKDLESIMGTNTYVIENMGKVTGNLYDAMLSLLAAADPLIRRFTDWVVVLTEGWAKSLDAKQASGELTEMFNYAGDVAAQLGRIIGNIAGALMNIGQAAAGPGSGGEMLLNMLEDSTARFEEWTQALLDNGRLEEFFLNVADNAAKISSLVVEIVKEFLKLGENKAIGDTAEALQGRLAPAVGTILDTLVEAAPMLGEFVSQIGELLQKFADSGSIKIFFGILNQILDVLNDIFGNAVVQQILIFSSSIFAVTRAFRTAGRAGKIFFKVAFGGIKSAVNVYQGIKFGILGVKAAFGSATAAAKLNTAVLKGNAIAAKVLTGVQKALAAIQKATWLTNPIFLVVAAIAALIATFVILYKRVEWFRNFVNAVWDGIKTAVGAVISFIKDNWKIMLAVLTGGISLLVELFIRNFDTIKAVFMAVWDGISAAISFVWENVIKPVFEAFKTVFELVWAGIKLYFETVWAVISTSISFIWENVIKPVFNAFRTVFEIAWAGIKLYFETVWKVISTSITTVWNNIIKPVFNAFKTVFELAWDGIKIAFTVVWDFIKGAVDTGAAVIRGLFNGIKTSFETAWNVIKAVFNGIWDGIKTSISIGVGFISGVFNGLRDGISRIWDRIKETGITAFNAIGSVVETIVNGIITAFEWGVNKMIDGINFLIDKYNAIPIAPDLPKLSRVTIDRINVPELAMGGVVSPSRGGTLALLAEAGRAERIEPLDRNGLSQRDKAIIEMFAKPNSTGTINMYIQPSPGMDESELASMVSRELALQLRRGTI